MIEEIVCWQVHSKPIVLIATDYYSPGYLAGGSLRSLSNLVASLGDEFQFKVVTRERDLGACESYPGVVPDRWCRVGKADVYYSFEISVRKWCQLLNEGSYDVLYLNSYFSFRFTILPLLLRCLKMIPDTPVILAPRGELFQGALLQKNLKKQIFHALASFVGLYSKILWQASSEEEYTEIRKRIGRDAKIVVAPDVPSLSILIKSDAVSRDQKKSGLLKIVFVGRIARVKNLHKAIEMLVGLEGQVEYNIYGPREDTQYWQECEAIIDTLPPRIKVSYKGYAPHEQIARILQSHHALLLPSLSENFGHVILESLLSATPVVLGDRTPWRELEGKNAGWVIPLNEIAAFRAALQGLIDMDGNTHEKWANGALEYGKRVLEDVSNTNRNRQMFLNAVDSRN